MTTPSLDADKALVKSAVFRKAHPPKEDGGEWIDTVRHEILAEEWNTSESRDSL